MTERPELPLLRAADLLREAATLFEQAHDAFEKSDWREARRSLDQALDRVRDSNGLLARRGRAGAPEGGWRAMGPPVRPSTGVAVIFV